MARADVNRCFGEQESTGYLPAFDGRLLRVGEDAMPRRPFRHWAFTSAPTPHLITQRSVKTPP